MKLLVIEKIHLLREEQGALFEAIFSCTCFISQHMQAQQAQQNQQFNKMKPETSTNKTNIVRISMALSNPADLANLANWMGISIPPTY